MKPRQITLVFAAIVCCLPGTARADTNVGGTISADTTWTVAGSPYIATSNVTVSSGVTLTIEPGVTVRVNPNLYIIVSGTLTAIGTASEPITITANSTEPTPGYWRSLRFEPGSSSTSQLAYATVAYGGYQYFSVLYYGNITVNQSSPSLHHLTITNSSTAGVYVVGSGAAPTIADSTFSGNSQSGVRVANAAAVTLMASAITANGGNGVTVDSSAEATVTDSAITDNTGYAFQAAANSRLLGLTGLTVTGNGGGTGDAVKHLGGDITASETWSSALEWHLSANLDVQASGTLTIEPGVTVKVGSDRWIAVFGTLTALGTPTEPIVITANSASPTPGYWRTLNFQGSTASNSQVAYVTVSYGGHNSSQGSYYGNLRVLGSAPSLDNVTVTGSSTAGLWVSGSTAAPSVTNSTFIGNSGPGVWVLQQGTATISDSAATANGVAGIRVGESLLYNQAATVTATNTEISGNTGPGVLVDSPATIAITSSAITVNGGAGVAVDSSGEATVTDTAITDNTGYAFQAAANSRLLGLTGLTVMGNASGTGDAVKHLGGDITTSETWSAALEWHLSRPWRMSDSGHVTQESRA